MNEEEINNKIKSLESRKQTVERLKENPYYVEYQKIMLVLKHGEHIDKLIISETKNLALLSNQISSDIERYKSEGNSPAPAVPVESDVPQSQPVQSHQKPVSAVSPTSTPSMTADEIVAKEAENSDDDIGITEDLNFDGMPDLDEDKEEDKKSKK